jgi:hypothetical protein
MITVYQLYMKNDNTVTHDIKYITKKDENIGFSN